MESKNNQDILFLKETLKLASKGLGRTFPNPLVGAVIVKNGKIIAKGYHKKVGFPHAEIEALREVKVAVKGATLYVNLEPCCHFGRTPPCTEAIIRAGIGRVVYCTLDPNPKVRGKGNKALQQAGIETNVGLLGQEARVLNEAFFIFHEKKRPFVAIKFAASLDGKIATRTGDSKWITNEKARFFARNLRGEYQAILVGINTVLVDDPHLGARLGIQDPLRVILDSRLRISLASHVLRDTNVLIATTKNADRRKLEKLQEKGIACISFPDERIPLSGLLTELRNRNIISLLVEGGGGVHGSFVDAKLVDKVYAFFSPRLIGGDRAINAICGKGARLVKDGLYLARITFTQLDDNFLVIGYPEL